MPSMFRAGLAGQPPEIGVYGYLLGGIGYALLGSSRQLAVGPTSAISLMVAYEPKDCCGGRPELCAPLIDDLGPCCIKEAAHA